MYRQYIDVLKKTTLFTGIKESEMEAMLYCMSPRISRYPRDSVIAIEHDPMEGIHILLKGSVTITKETEDGGRTLLAKYHAGNLFGEMAAFSESKRWPATVEASEDSKVMALPIQNVVGVCSNSCGGHRLLIINMLTILSEKAMRLNRRVEYLSIRTLRGKISRMLLDQYEHKKSPYIRLGMNRSEMADFLGVTRPSLSRELGHMQDEGILEYAGREFKLTDLEAMRMAIRS